MPINIPKGVNISLDEGGVTVKGPRGQLSRAVPEGVSIEMVEQTAQVKRRDDSNEARSLHGLMRALLNNMVRGVSEGFVRGLEIQGTGYRAEVQGEFLNLNLGFSHPIKFPLPEGVKATVEKANAIKLEGIDFELLGQTAARIRDLRPAEPYKGKGVRYAGEHVHRKVGKTGSKK